MTPVAEEFADHILPFQLDTVGVRGRLVRLGPTVDAVIRPHCYPPPVAAIVAEALALGVVLASSLKYDGVFTLQLQGEGPVRLIVVDVTSEGDVRACARFEADGVGRLGAVAEAPIPRLFGAGLMAFTVDQGPATERYQGITALEGARLGDCAHAYFRQSEQLETAILLCTSDFSGAPEPPRAAAIMIQRLPPSLADLFAEDDWRRAVMLMSTATAGDMLRPALPSAQILYRLFHEEGVRVFRQRALRHRCRCSRERVVRTLSAFPRDQLAAMAEPALGGRGPRVVVVCEFCKARYELALAELSAGGNGRG